jgi:hypothetical protein
MKRLLLLAAFAAAVVALVTWRLAPPAARTLPTEPVAGVQRGALHVHTTRSDGAGSPEDVAAAAARAGLDFVILTDHGDATRAPDTPRRIDGVLLIDAVEISTTGGHYLAIGLPQAPYRLAGEPRDVIEDVARLGGFGIAAHPDSPKADLSWREWQAPFPGLEWLNADSAWRDEPRDTLLRVLAGYWWRPPEAIASLFDRPATTLARWDALARRRAVVAVAGHDAHARLGARGEWDGAPDQMERYSLRVPGYETAFRTFSLGVWTDPLTTTSAAADAAAAILDGIRRGRAFTVVDALAGPARLEFTATSGGDTWQAGDDVPPGRDVTLRAVVVSAPSDATLVVVKDGQDAASGRGPISVEHRASDPASSYRIEARLDRAPGVPPVPWIVGNPIRVGFAAAATTPSALPPASWARALPQSGWTIEQHPASSASLAATVLAPGNTAWTLEWQLGKGKPAGQYAAMAVPLPPDALGAGDRLSFTARGASPMRVSVQLRSHAGGGARWRRSVYVPSRPIEVSLGLREFLPVDAPPTGLDAAAVDSLLFVIDTVNTAPGSGGELTVSALRVEGAEGAARQVRTVSSR